MNPTVGAAGRRSVQGRVGERSAEGVETGRLRTRGRPDNTRSRREELRIRSASGVSAAAGPSASEDVARGRSLCELDPGRTWESAKSLFGNDRVAEPRRRSQRRQHPAGRRMDVRRAGSSGPAGPPDQPWFVWCLSPLLIFSEPSSVLRSYWRSIVRIDTKRIRR